MSAGTLYLVATPIGNLEDLTLRALRVLREVDHIAAEDTRHTSRLLRHYGIRTPMISYHAHNERARAAALLVRLRAGESVALVADAGTPGISDPGAALVRACVDEGVAVVPVPGASAPLAALAASGLPTDRFLFLGFPSRRAGERGRLLTSLRREPGTLVFFESPNRLPATLGALAEALGDRDAVIAREITKRHEEFARGSLLALRDRYANAPARGEVTILVAGAGRDADVSIVPEDATMGEDLDGVLRASLAGGAAVRAAAAAAAERCGVPRRVAYQRALAIRDGAADAPLPGARPR